MKIDQNLTTVNYGVGGGTDRIQYIVIHFTGKDGDTAWANTNYVKSKERGSSAHYFVDEDSVWQCVPDKDVAWHCRATETFVHPYCRNENSLGIGMCCRKYNDALYYFKEATVNNTVWLTAMLMAQYDIPPERVLRHYDVTGDNCPEPFVRDDTAWDAFQARLSTVPKAEETNGISKAEMEEIAAAAAREAVERYIRSQEEKAVSDWAKAFWDEAFRAGTFDGTMPKGFLTREQAAATYGKMGITGLSSDQAVSGWAKDIWAKAVRLGLLDGSAPKGPLTREQFVVVLSKLGLL